MQERHVVFDLDGTLVDSVHVCARIVDEMRAARGVTQPAPLEEVRRYNAVGGATMVAALLGAASSDRDAEIREFRARYAELPTPSESLFPGAREALERLRDAGYLLSVCSNKPQALCDKVLRELDLARYFSAVVGRTPDRPSKPDPAHLGDALARAAQRGGALPAPCVYVGDSEVDVELSRRAGVPLILVAHGYGDFDAVPTGAVLARRFDEVPECVEHLLRAAQ
jgi:phosphoglycolate phosphatase